MDQEIRAIRNDADHAWALAEYERYFDAAGRYAGRGPLRSAGRAHSRL